MKTWFKNWTHGQKLDLEGELRSSRPTPSSHLVKSIAARVNPRPVNPVRIRSRIAVAGVATAVMVAAVGASGAFSSAATSVLHAARATATAVHLDTPPASPGVSPTTNPSASGPRGSAAAQYLGAPTITKLSVTLGKVGTTVNVLGTNLGGITAMTVAGLSIDVSTIGNSSTSSVTFKVPSTGSSAFGPVTVTNPAGTATSPTNFTVEVSPAGVTLSDSTFLEPGEVVHITGSGFLGVDLTGGSVKFNNKAAATVSVLGDGHIDATVPTGVTAGVVKVTNLAGFGQSASYTVAPGPHVSSFTPMSGIQGTTVKITGTGFVNGQDNVTFGSSASHAATFVSATQITATVPADATLGKITVADAVGSSSSVQNFTPIFAPAITGFAPSPGTKVGGTVTLTGTGFLGTSSVKFTGGAAGKVAAFKVTSDTSLTAVVPAGAANGAITVTNAAGHDSSNTGSFTVLTAPAITGITAPALAVAGDSVHITGTNFVDTSTVHPTVLFGTLSATPTAFTGTTIDVNVPVGAKTGKLKVVTAGGTSAPSTQTVTIAPAPTVSSFTATSQIADGNHTITITGKGFNGTNSAVPTVTFGSGGNGVVQAGNTDTKLVVKVPANAEIGAISVTTNAGVGTSKASFTPLKTPNPVSFWPSQGQKIGGTLTISGTQLSGATLVTFQQNGTHTPFTAKPKVLSDNNLTVVVPAGAASGTITVTNPAGTSAASLGSFVVLLPPTINALPGGLSLAGTTLTINGHNFVNTDDLSVTATISGKSCTSVSVVSPTQVTCTIPAGITGKKLPVMLSEEAGKATSAPFQF